MTNLVPRSTTEVSGLAASITGHGREAGATSRGQETSRPFAATKAASGLSYRVRDDGPILPNNLGTRTWYFFIKRTFDILASLAGLIFFAPLLLAVFVAIKLSSPGPAVFRQARYGRRGVPFDVFKFRSLQHQHADVAGTTQAMPNDERLTRVGALIRRTSIDELPQLWNILRGDMSVVGPRPHAIGMLAAGVRYEDLVPYYHRRHAVRPGLTGWAQANGLRGPTVRPELAVARIDHDLAYIQNMSLRLDVRIIFETLRYEFLTGSGV